MEATLSYPPLSTKQSRESTTRRVGLVMTYNQKETCIEAINSLIAQTLALDLIIVSDDCSTDGTYEVIADHLSRNGKPSNVELYQSEKNLGFIPHFNTLLKKHCRDEDLIFYNAGDDISETSRVEEFYREYVTKGKPQYFLGHSYVTSFGSGTEEILVPPIESIKENRELCLIASAYHIGASQVFTGALFFDFGPILFDDCYEDLTLGYRALLKNAYHFIPKALLRYRIGGLSSWQKNPLGKKRSRLKSTLTQRAVDSMRSGDFGALTTIQDCYSQYGFSHTPHPKRVRVTIISDEIWNSQQYTYSIADHFTVVNNICETSRETPASFLVSTRHGNRINTEPTDLIWIIAPRVQSVDIWKIIESLTFSKTTRIVIDLGLAPSLKQVFTNLDDTEINAKLSSHFSNIEIHTSNVNLYTASGKIPSVCQFTYLAPLQNIDGPDPIAEPLKNKKGIIVVLDTSPESEETVLLLEKQHSSSAAILEKPSIVRFFRPESKTGIKDQNTSDLYQNLDTAFDRISLNSFHYLAIVSGPMPCNTALVHYLWTLGAKHMLPTFINAKAPRPSNLIHGNNCLFVDTCVNAWSAALSLIHSDYGSLKNVASNARRDTYFNFSIQKKIRDVSDLLIKRSRSSMDFEKFLPL